MKYNLDIESLSVQNYKDILKKQNLLPGRRILLKNIDENFSCFEKSGIINLAQLNKSLSSPQKIAEFAAVSGISEDYLVILKREMGSLMQKPVLLASFPDIDPSLVNALNDSGIKNSKDYWEQTNSANNILFSLCDLVRINGVGPIAAKVFYEAGYRCVSDVSEADAAVLLANVTAINEARHYYKAKLGLKDIQFCIDFALLLKNMNV